MSKGPEYYREEMEMDRERQHATDLLKQTGEIAKPYGSEVLGSFSFHVCAKTNILTGKGELSVAKVATEMNISQDAAKAVAEIVRDESLRLLGMKMMNTNPLTKDQKLEQEDLQKEIAALARQQGLN